MVEARESLVDRNIGTSPVSGLSPAVEARESLVDRNHHRHTAPPFRFVEARESLVDRN